MEVKQLPLKVGSVTPSGGLFNYQFRLSQNPTNNLHAATLSYLNNKADLYLDKVDGAMQGPLTISYVPSNSNAIIAKQYVDNLKAQLQANPVSTYLTNKLNLFINKEGDNLSNEVILAQNPVTSKEAATLSYLNARVVQITGSATAISPVLPGTIVPFPSDQTVSNSSYLYCNGASIDKTLPAYVNMANVIGTKFNKYYKEGGGVPWLNQNAFNFNYQPNNLVFSSSVALPRSAIHSLSFVTKNKAYVIVSGTNVDIPFTTYRADLDIDGNINSWQTVSVNYPYPRVEASAVVSYKDYIYAIGNFYTSSNTVYNHVIKTQVNLLTGDINDWSTDTPYPIACSHMSAAITTNKIYCAGGFLGSNFGSSANITASCYYATINTDGSLSAWQAGPTLPGKRAAGRMMAIGDKMYFIGGWDGSSSRTEIYVSNIDSNGLLGTWSLAGYIPDTTGLHGHSLFATKYAIYVFGTKNTTPYVSKAFKININPDNTIGDISALNVPNNIYYACAVFAAKNKIYFVSGQNSASTFSPSTFYISVAGTLNDYTPYTSTSVNSLPSSNYINIPDLTYREYIDPSFKYYIKL